MNTILEIQDCQKTFNFSPETPWPELLPAYCYDGELLCGFNRLCGPVIQLEKETLAGCFKALYPELSFQELSRLSTKLPFDINLLQELWALYGFRWKESLFEVCQKVSELPMEVQGWLHLKKLGPQDLAPLRSIPSVQILNDFWPYILKFNFSKSEGTKLIELLVELLLLEIPQEKLLPQSQLGTQNQLSKQKNEIPPHSISENLNIKKQGSDNTTEGSAWLKYLFEIRHPQSTQQDRMAEKSIVNLGWPLKSEARWSRRGDRAGIEFKMFFSHPQELKRSLDRLQQICINLSEKNEYEDLWSKN